MPRALKMPTMVAVLVFLQSATTGYAQCALSTDAFTHQRVEIRPPGVKPFVVSVEGVAVMAEVPHAPGRPIHVSVRGPVVFDGAATNVWTSLIAEHTSRDGEVSLRKGARFIPSHVRSKSVIGTAVIEAGDVLEGEYKHPEIFVRGVSVPCAKLSLTPPFLSLEEEEASLATPLENAFGSEESERVYLLRHGRFRVPLRGKPNFASDARVVQSPHCNNCLQFVGHEQRGRWLEVSAGGSGVRVRGWAPVGWLVKAPGGLGYPTGCSGDHDSLGLDGHGWGGGGPPDDLYIGKAVVKAGTKVSSAPGRSAWATVKEKVTVLVWHKRDSEWVQLRYLPGIQGTRGSWPFHAFVSSRAVELLENTAANP